LKELPAVPGRGNIPGIFDFSHKIDCNSKEYIIQ
jgi:hypothetical protein